jgi:hypothetical protein
MIPERYREKLPPYWYENEVAQYHFEGTAAAIDAFKAQREDVEAQFFPWSATWALDIWEWIYFGQKQTGSIEERRKNIQRKHWAQLGFTPSVLRAIGLSVSTLKKVEMQEDFQNKMIRYVFLADDTFDAHHATAAVERIRPVHCNGVVLEPVAAGVIEMKDTLIVGVKQYHVVSEFRVGMTPIKSYGEVVV